MTEKNLKQKALTVPTNLFFSLDSNLRSALVTLTYLSETFGDSNGWFFRTDTDLQRDLKSPRKLVIAILETLFRNNLLQVRTVGLGTRRVNYFKLNEEEFKKWEQFSVYEIQNIEELNIELLKYNDKEFVATYALEGDVAQDEETSSHNAIASTYSQTTLEPSHASGNVPSCPSNDLDEQLPTLEQEEPLERKKRDATSDVVSTYSAASTAPALEVEDEKSSTSDLKLVEVDEFAFLNDEDDEFGIKPQEIGTLNLSSSRLLKDDEVETTSLAPNHEVEKRKKKSQDVMNWFKTPSIDRLEEERMATMAKCTRLLQRFGSLDASAEEVKQKMTDAQLYFKRCHDEKFLGYEEFQGLLDSLWKLYTEKTPS